MAVIAALLAESGIAAPVASATTSALAVKTGDVALGVHDGSINNCDNDERWVADGHGGMAAAPVNAGAAQQALLDSSWFKLLNAGTVRFLIPWDIALPDAASGADQSLVTAHDPVSPTTDRSWKALHASALRNEQACFDWWLNAAATAGVTVEVDLKPDYDYRSTTFLKPSAGGKAKAHSEILAPSIDTYRIAAKDFVAEYSTCSAYGVGAHDTCKTPTQTGLPSTVARVHVIAAWNEPDFTSKHLAGNALSTPRGTIPQVEQKFHLPRGDTTLDNPTCTSAHTSSTDADRCGPVLAAQYWTAIHQDCDSACTLANKAHGSGVVAGDFSSGIAAATGEVEARSGITSRLAYWQTYAAHLGVRADTWAIHPYNDVSDWEYCTANGDMYPPAGRYTTKTVQFADGLHAMGYGSGTGMWLNEVSVFRTDMMDHHNGPGGCQRDKQGQPSTVLYSQHRQDLAFQWLDRVLPHTVPAGDPQVTRIIYYRVYSQHQQDRLGRALQPGDSTACLYKSIVQRESLKGGATPPGC